ncbi:DUF4124 domain-containing protein [Undibacterium sp.]|uniref:DUF4124 domain-containing protein n=1 Tax=Undibacterium sp. TaxID=1914977 RepID=UPI003752D8D4
MKIFYRICLIALFALLSMSAQAQMRKCVTGSGKSIYTDQPCSNKVGEKSTEIKDSEVLKKVSSINGQRDLEKSCWVLSHRDSQCDTNVNYELRTVFKENCTLPIKQFEKEQDNEKKRPRQYYEREREQDRDGDDLEYEHRYTRKSRAVLQCEALEKNMWDFLKLNFGKRISDQDAKIINYKLKILPTNEEKNWRQY